MEILTERLSFLNSNGVSLEAELQSPQGVKPRAYALFAHCFTCSKKIPAAFRITRALAAEGIATLSFDFTGLGNSDGDFSETNFSSNVSDLIDAAEAMKRNYEAPSILIGHSLGGASVLAAACSLSTVEAVVTIGAPSDPAHVSNLFHDHKEKIEKEGQAEVILAGRKFVIKNQFLKDLNQTKLLEAIRKMSKALLVLHSPQDEIVEYKNGSEIFEAAPGPKSFVALDGANHLLTRAEDSEYTANLISAWVSRYLQQVQKPAKSAEQESLKHGEVYVGERDHKFTVEVLSENHRLISDEPKKVGGADMGPSPYEYLLGSLGSCTVMTLRMYANHKGLPVTQIGVMLKHSRVHADDCGDCEAKDGKLDLIERELTIEGDLTDEQRKRMTEIADRCPVHKTLTHGNLEILTKLK